MYDIGRKKLIFALFLLNFSLPFLCNFTSFWSFFSSNKLINIWNAFLGWYGITCRSFTTPNNTFQFGDTRNVSLFICICCIKKFLQLDLMACSPILHWGSTESSPISEIRFTWSVFHFFYPCDRYRQWYGVTDWSKSAPLLILVDHFWQNLGTIKSVNINSPPFLTIMDFNNHAHNSGLWKLLFFFCGAAVYIIYLVSL